MRLPNDYSIILVFGLLLIISTASVSLALAVDSFRCESFFQSAQILNSITIGYSTFLLVSFIYYYFNNGVRFERVDPE